MRKTEAHSQDKGLDRDYLVYIITVVWLAAIWTVSSIPLQQLPSVKIFGWDKLGHLGQYLILGLLVNRCLISMRKKPGVVVIVYIRLLLSAALDEWHQRFVPFRSVSLWDFLANAAGLGLGCAGYWIYRDRSKKPAA